MKNITNMALIAVCLLSLASCGEKLSGSNHADSTSTTVKIDSSTKVSVSIDSAQKDTAKQITVKPPKPAKPERDPMSTSSMRAMRDSIKKDSIALSKK